MDEIKRIELWEICQEVRIGNMSEDEAVKEICSLFESKPEVILACCGKSESQCKCDEPKPEYTLNCDKCGKVFSSSEAFPVQQLCPQCSKNAWVSGSSAKDMKKAYRQGLIDQSIKSAKKDEAECQARVERIFTAFESWLNDKKRNSWEWQEFKRQVFNQEGIDA